MELSKPIQIAISGDLGSGKSAVSQILTLKYNLKNYSTGKLLREMAAKQGMNALEFNQLAEDNQEIDFEIDSFSKSLNNSTDSFIIDSRLAWFFIKKSFKVFLSVDENIAAERILNHSNRISEKYDNLDEVLTSIKLRKKSEVERYFKLYGINLNDPNNYDLVVDTSSLTIEEVAQSILENLAKHKN